LQLLCVSSWMFKGTLCAMMSEAVLIVAQLLGL